MKEWTALIIAPGHLQKINGLQAPLVKVAGLTVLERIVKCIQHLGATKLRLVVENSTESQPLINEAQKSWKDSESFECINVDPGLSETEIVALGQQPGQSPDQPDENLFITYADLSFSPNIVKALIQEKVTQKDEEKAPEKVNDKVGVKNNGPESFVAVRTNNSPDENQDKDKDPFFVQIGNGEQYFSGLAFVSSKSIQKLKPGLSIAHGFRDLAEQNQLFLRPMENSHVVRIINQSTKIKAEKCLVQSLRRNSDGLISRWLNRPVSLTFTRFLFVRLPLTPNHITFLAAAIGWLAIWIIYLWPGYWWVLLGTLLFHFSSILDGCDGEVARLRYQFSRFGEWFDNVLDEINNAAFIAAIGFGAYNAGASQALAWAAGFYVLSVVVCNSAAFYQLVRWRGGSGNVDNYKWFFESEEQKLPSNPTAFPPKLSLSDILSQIPRRDFYIFLFLLLAAANLLVVGFWASIAAGTALFILGIIQWYWQIAQELKKHASRTV